MAVNSFGSSFIKEELNRKQMKLQQKIGARDSMLERRDAVVSELKKLSENISNTEKAVMLIQKYSQDQQEILAERVEGIVTAGIRAVFQDPTLTFKMVYSESKSGTTKKKPEIQLKVVYEHEGKEVEGNLKNSFGGGLAVVVATLLQVIVILHMQPRLRPILLLDEPISDLSPNYPGSDTLSGELRERMADFVRSLTEDTPLQAVVVSHEEQLGQAADKHWRFKGGIGKEPIIEDRSSS